MAHQWDRGVLSKSSWHGLEDLGVMANSADLIAAGERSGAWPTALRSEALFTAGGLKAADVAIVGAYQAHPDRVLGVVGENYRATTPDEWRGLCDAACHAGASPTGAFSLRDGSRVLATFGVGVANGLRTNLMLCDSFDGSLSFTTGFTTIDVVCANTLAVAMRQNGNGMAKIRHTVSAEAKIAALTATIGDAIASGQSVRATYEAAKRAKLDRSAAKRAFDALFPPATEDATAHAKARAESARDEAMAAAALPINRRDNDAGTVATLWNTATWLVDRNVDGTPRKARGDADRLDSMLFGARARRVEEIQTLIEVIMRDGSVQAMTLPQAADAGVDPQAVGAKLLAEMLG